MTQVASLAVAATALPDSRVVADAPAGDTPPKGEFSDIFERLGGDRSENDSGAAQSGEEATPADTGKEKGPRLALGAGLHRLLASERLGTAQAANDDGRVTEAALDGSADRDESGDPVARKTAGGEATDGAVNCDRAFVSGPAMTAIPSGLVAAVAAAVAKPTTDARQADTEPDKAPGRGTIVVRPEAADGTPAVPVRVPVTVESVETHFALTEAIKAPMAEVVEGDSTPSIAGKTAPAIAKAAGMPVAPAMEDAEPVSEGDGAVAEADTRPVKGPAATRAVDKPAKPDADGGKAGGQATIARSDAPVAQTPASGLLAATVGQVGTAIAGAARAITEQAAAEPVAGGEVSARAVVKVLNIRLDPPEYGSVSVRLTLQGGALSVQIRAERETTAAALDRDRENIAEHLKASGYGTDASMIDTRRDMAVMRSDGAAGPGSGAGNGSPAEAGGGRSTDGGGARRDDGNGGGQGPARRRDDGGDGAAARDPGARGLYV